jgi:hypothetical protein
MKVSDTKSSANSKELKSNQDKPKKILEAHTQAEKDIAKDLDLTNKPDPAADLDEGELARLEGEK